MRIPKTVATGIGLCVLALGAAGGRTVDPTPTPVVSRPVTSPGNAEWASTLEEAKQRAAREEKFVFFQFDRAGRACGLCRRMESLLYPAMDFEAILISMVPVKVGLDSPEGRELARRYGVEDAPSIVVATPEGRVVFQVEGFRNAPEFYEHIHRDLDAYRSFAKQIEQQDIAHLPAREALETGRQLYDRLDSGSALPRLRRAVSAPDATPEIRDEAREALAAVELDLGQIAASRQTTERLIATTRDKKRRERAELFRAQIPLAENKPEEAVQLYRKFRKDHPDSEFRAKVDAILQRLTGSAPRS
jgi:thioredoxin-related protein